MIITIRITEAAIEYLEREARLDRETAEEIIQMVLGLCDKTGSMEKPEETKRAEELADSTWEAYSALVENGIRPHLYKSLGEGIEALGKKPGLRIRKAARDLLNTASGYIKDAFPHDMREALRILRESMDETEEELSQDPESDETRLRKTALALLDYYDRFGPDEFRRHSGVKGVSDEALLEICREIIQEGEGRSSE